MEAKAMIGKEAAITGLVRIEGRVVIFVVWITFIFPTPRSNVIAEWSFFLSWPIAVFEWL